MRKVIGLMLAMMLLHALFVLLFAIGGWRVAVLAYAGITLVIGLPLLGIMIRLKRETDCGN